MIEAAPLNAIVRAGCSPFSGVARDARLVRLTLKDVKARYGQRYRDLIKEVHTVLADVKGVFPEYDGAGHELSGLVWFQGFNDVINTEYRAEYGKNMVHFIRDVRKDLGASDLPVVIGELGMDGVEVNPRWATSWPSTCWSLPRRPVPATYATSSRTRPPAS